MAILLQTDNLTKSYGDRLLVADACFTLNEGDKVGIVARNGAGKSTLLRMLAGLESPDSGTVTPRRDLRVALLEQNPTFDPALSLLDNVAGNTGHDDDDRHDRARRMLTQVGLERPEQLDVAHLSGGQRKRAAIVRTLLADADILLLDEPTNHLDINIIEWLEAWLRRSRTTLLMVTHDRYFLDRVCSRIIEIDQQQIYQYEGNYENYLRRRAERLEAEATATVRARNLLRREQDWMDRQPQARAGKARARIDRYYELRDRANHRRNDREITLDTQSGRTGSKIFEARDVCKSFGDKKILDRFNYTFARGEKIGIVGPNGVGKSTLIKMLQGLIAPDSGEWDVGTTVRFGYYRQEGLSFDPADKVIDAITRIAPTDISLNDGALRLSPMQWLQRFLFSVPDQQKRIESLSGGERCRLHLATVMMRQPNFLILDEPTNDLDIATLGILEDYLADFKGCAIIISHDRYFLDTIVDHTLVMEGNGVVRDFPGNYSDYRAWADARKQQAAADDTSRQTSGTKQRTARPAKMTWAERREFEALTAEIAAMTAERQQLTEMFSSGTMTAEEAARHSARYEQLTADLDEREMRWLELSEKDQ